MEEIKVGEYVRDKEGNITKIINTLSLFKDVELYLGEDGYQYSDNAIVKHSFNIIDLIEEGDYVNGYYCRRIPNFGNKMCNFDLNTMEWTPLENIDIWYNVVTKEQFQSVEYRLEE